MTKWHSETQQQTGSCDNQCYTQPDAEQFGTPNDANVIDANFEVKS